MLDIRWKAALHIAAFGTISLFLWLVGGKVVALSFFTITLLFYIARQLYWLHILHLWLKHPSLDNVPVGSGIWEVVYDTLLKYERKNNEKQTQLNAALDRFNTTANAIPDGLIVLNASNEIEWCTANAEIHLDLNLPTDLKLPIVNLVRSSDFIAYLYNGIYEQPFRLELSRNAKLILEIRLITLPNQEKLLISRDVTQAEKLDGMRRDFIANVSHELRTPLTVVGGFIETLSDIEGAIPDNIRDYFDMMQEQTTRMRRLIDDLLTLSQIESNTHPPEDKPINMTSLINIMLSDAKALSRGKHVITTEILTDNDISGAADELQSALSNLISNAVRYTPEGGGINIIWQTRGDQAMFSVCDNGIGIEAQHMERLTERFYRVDRSRSRETGGTGLGLSIVKHILTRHQAKLEISSELGKGSQFSAIFPKSRLLRR
ncbi:MAG: phosphate regulon sensor histidine kinase PhoR [Betaproteobacteria bacterium]|nr:phosphate regulon sensor histidine kinase PhoR [Betaproteobacteria bacterium]